MPTTVVNYSGDDEFYGGGSFCSNPMDMGRFCSVDVYYPPNKRARVCAPFPVAGLEQDKKSKPSIEVLPDECLFEIFRHIPGSRDRKAAACVSKHWLFLLGSMRKAEILKNQSVPDYIIEDEGPLMEGEKEIKVSITNEDGDLKSEGHLTRCLEGKKVTDVRLVAIAVGTSGCGGLEKLSIRGNNSVRGITGRGLSAVARASPSLRTLSLWDIASIGDESLSEVARECRSLEKLDLCHCPRVSSKGIMAIAENCPNLTSLSIESCSRVGNEGLESVGRFCPQLQSISIKDCPLVSDRGVASLVSSSSSVLSKVKLHGLNITDFTLAVIGHYGQAITNLILGSLKNATEKGFWVMGNAHGLQKLYALTVFSCGGFSDVSLEAVGKGCSNLKQMSLNKCCSVSDNGLLAFAKAANALESLQLEDMNRVSQVGIAGILSNCGTKLKSLSLVKCMGIKDPFGEEAPILSPCPSLRSLIIQNCPGFGNASLSIAGKLCPHIQNINLTGLWGITDAGLIPLLENAEDGLIEVNLSSCVNITDEAVSALSRLHGGTIELLNLDGCRRVTDASLVSVSDNCLLLNDLDVSRCAVSDSGVTVLSSAEQINLQVLSLSGCSLVTNKSLAMLKQMGGSLVGLNLQNCQNISSVAVENLSESLWRCDILY